MFGYYGGHMGAIGWSGAVIGTLVFWVLIAGVIGVVLRDARGRTPYTPPRPSDPTVILAERFARGEIDEDEYRQRLQVLRDQRS